MIDLSGKTVLVTGAGGGIGAAIARTLARAGGAVVLHDVAPSENLDAICTEIGPEQSVTVYGDLADDNAPETIWDEAAAWRGRIDVLVNNAGIYEPADISDTHEIWSRAWQRTLQINLLAPAHFCRCALRHFRAKGGGILINLASRAAFRGDDADYMHYAASKAGIIGMTRTIARHFGRAGVTAFAVAPGFVETSLNRVFIEQHGVDVAAEDIPLGEVAQPQDIANTIAFLASGLARHATGTTIDINGASYVR